MLKAIGFWYGQDADQSLIDPKHLVAPEWERENRKNVVQYLRSGSPAYEWMGYSWCRFECGIEDHEMGDSELTDGVWCWPSGLAHYVEFHEIKLPNEFVRHAESTNWKPREIVEPIGDHEVSEDDFVIITDPSNWKPQKKKTPVRLYDIEFWRTWCRNQIGCD